MAPANEAVTAVPIISEACLNALAAYHNIDAQVFPPERSLSHLLVCVFSNIVALERRFRAMDRPSGPEAEQLWGSATEYFQNRWHGSLSESITGAPCITMGGGSPDPSCCARMGWVVGSSPFDFKIARDFVLYIDNRRQDIRAELGLGPWSPDGENAATPASHATGCMCERLLALGQKRIESILQSAPEQIFY